jgi:NAD(P)-dependent dehydrogenase (short-subunit alcohol dehydrogenase family)
MGRLDNKVAAVTGGASGIGEATSDVSAERANVAFCDRDGERGQRVAGARSRPWHRGRMPRLRQRQRQIG